MKQYLALAAILKDDADYVQEWLTFYDMIGVERFCLALHNCTDGTEQAIKQLPFCDTKIRLYRVLCEYQAVQMGTYRELLKLHGNSTRWMMFVDGDEFLFPCEKNDLREVLCDYENYGAVAANWAVFGSSGLTGRPAMPSIKHFTHRKPDTFSWNKSVKSIVQPAKVIECLSPHTFHMMDDTVTENGVVISPGSNAAPAAPSYNKLCCNHYFTRSAVDWERRKRLPRDLSDAMFARLNENSVEDLKIQRFVPELEKRLLEAPT